MSFAGLFSRFVLLTTLIISYQLHAQRLLNLQVEGVTGALKDNVEIYLQKFSEEEAIPGNRLHDALRLEAEKALQALGYYHSVIRFEADNDDPLQITLHIDAGPAVVIQLSDIKLSGDAATDDDFLHLVQQAPKTGAVLHHGRYESTKTAMRNLALRKGYFDARFTLQQLKVAAQLNQAFIHLHFDSGKRYRFGDVQFNGSQIDKRRLEAMLPFQSGDVYLASKLGELNQSLAASGWFSSILVEGDTEHMHQQHLPIQVNLAPQRRNIVETGIGYSTDIGARLKLNWLKPWLNRAGHSLRSDLAVSEIEQSVEAAYKMPLQSAATDFYQVQLGFRNRDSEDTASRESNLVLERHWLLNNNWYQTASLRWLYEDFVQADQRDNISLLMPGINYNRTVQQGGAMPHSASRLALRVEVSDEAWGSDASFVRLRGRAGWIGSTGNNHRFVTRLDGGAILMETLRKLPPSLRFFAGGDNSIRGFAFESLSPVNDNGELIGGRYLLTGSVEYQYRLKGNWWLAAFTDYGSAWNDKPDWQQGVGMGLRWASPVGPIRLDFAFGLDQPGSGFQLHFALGPEL